MASHKAFLGWFLFFAITAVGLHIAGFVYPGWISMRTKGEKITVAINNMMMTQNFEGQPIDQGGLPGPMGPMMPEGQMPPMRDDGMGQMHGGMGMDGEHHGDHDGSHHDDGRHHDDMRGRRDMHGRDDKIEMMERPEKQKEEFTLVEFIRTVTVDVEDFEVSIHYGLWFSKMCVHMEKPKGAMMEQDDVIAEEETVDDDDDVMMEKRDASSSSSEDGSHGRHHGKRRHCHCKKVSTRCALKMAFLFESPLLAPKQRLSADNIGHASLKEHQVETTLGLALMLLGVLGGIASFRKPKGCRCVKLTTVIILLVAVALIAVPVVRITQYSHHRYYRNECCVDIRCPLSAILSSASCAMTFLAAFVTFVGMLAQNRKERPGRWYQFNNELTTAEEEEKEKKGPALVFYNDDQYPVKAGLVDVCDFKDVKPEFSEPEKTPLE